MRAIMIVIALLASIPAAASEISPIQLELAAWCGAKTTVLQRMGERFAAVECVKGAQTAYVLGEAAAPFAAQVVVDLRQENIEVSYSFMVKVMRHILDDKEWPDAQRFIEKCLNTLYVPEKKELRLGTHSISLQRNSDVMMTMIVARRPKPWHDAFDPWKD
ncbi:protein of unknown function [Magnetospirillum sp. XM-1]|uniref:hypothetical protein n=1 Tax=Magnetospirillum sp. XM-1 TaxID=1663591 RepID=UPI00073DC559|nr:hypothetical protein [Magnetospirillum sp. XM-1]CUW41096.1 protein of unknown function [Magnetospirillum sp. XM-1]